MRGLQDRCMEKGRKLYHASVDLEKAFDRVLKEVRKL